MNGYNIAGIKKNWIRRLLLCVFILPVVAYITISEICYKIMVNAIGGTETFIQVWKGDK